MGAVYALSEEFIRFEWRKAIQTCLDRETLLKLYDKLRQEVATKLTPFHGKLDN